MTDEAARTQSEPQASARQSLDQGTYDVIRNRLTAQARELRARLDRLNTARQDVFGSIETRLIATERITTDHNCIPRDIVAVGDLLLVGFNVQFGLKTDIHLDDVLAIYRFKDHAFTEQPLDLLRDPAFEKDFRDLYRFYKGTFFARFFLRGPHLYMKFQVGRDHTDFKAFKFLVQSTPEGARLKYLDNRSDHEVVYPAQHEFEWKRASRDYHRHGRHPHVSIQDLVFVETVGGDLTIKVENNTETGEGIYSEPVDNPDQTLDDAEIHYAVLGHLVLLRVRPYQEREARHFIFNTKLQTVVRVDALADAAVLLPDDHGLVFANGYHLATGVHQSFPIDGRRMTFERRIAAPNGEDFLYVFYNRVTGEFALLAYNLIQQKIETPVVCHGYSLFSDGELVNFRSHDDPQKHHALQVWQTPFVGPNHQPLRQSDSYLFKIGNRDIVRGMAECVELLTLLQREEPYASQYVDIVKKSASIIDGYFWLGHEECFALAESLKEIRATAETAVGEFEKITRARRNTEQQTAQVSRATRELISRNASRIYDHINIFVEALAGLRQARGEVIALRQLRYVDAAAVDGLETLIQEQNESLGRRAVEFLLNPDSLTPYDEDAEGHTARIDALTRVTDARELEDRINRSSGDLELLIEIVSNLHIDDATQRTTIIDNISTIFTKLNAARSRLRNRRQELGRVEGIAEFNSQLKLLGQSVANYLDLCDTAERTDEFLTRMMVQVEELEGRFAEFDEFVLQLAEKRQEIYNAFENRKLLLIERRNKRVQALSSAVDRILTGVQSRVESFKDVAQINAYYAADLMIEKVRDIVAELQQLGDSVKVDDIQSRLKTIRENAVRQLRDRQELFEEGESLIRFGRHRFSVNSQLVDLTTIVREGRMLLHLSGTRFFETIEDEVLNRHRQVWDQEVVSENAQVYRAEYLAFLMLNELGGGSFPNAEALAVMDDGEVLMLAQAFMAPRYTEGYVKGVHDVDAAILLKALAELHTAIDLLRFSPSARAFAAVFWHISTEEPARTLLESRLRGYGVARRQLSARGSEETYEADIRRRMHVFLDERPVFERELVDEAAAYLFHELIREHRAFVASPEANHWRESFLAYLKLQHAHLKFEQSLEAIASDPLAAFGLARDWARAYLAQSDLSNEVYAEYLDEVAAQLLIRAHDPGRLVEATVRRELTGFVGSHPRLRDGAMTLHYNEFMRRLERFVRETVPAFQEYTQRKKAVLDEARHAMRLDEFKAKVLSSFVRNRLIDSVFLPLIGDNLAKQIGSAGENKRTDRSGLLLLISPPGYGKTTLMEYIADRLGLIFMKINGPAVGHHVTSLDPSEAPNAAAREELHKLNLALEMGDNVMLYVDDIQHCNTEFLQKFISLCDAQRRIEGVYKGRTRTYDFRGRKMAVVMAGNPYTESGEKFRIPDMLANRADTYNLGDIIGDHGDAFKLSYIENAMTSSPSLNAMAGRFPKDIYGIVRIVETGSREGVELEGNYTVEEVAEMTSVVAKLIEARDIILRVNQEYIRSAGMEDQYRTEPPFLMQGSYRNMNRITEKVVPVMNDHELRTLILSAYEQDSQTLTTGAEANLLKFKEMMGWLSPDEAARWAEIKRTFARNNQVRALGGEERAAAIIAQLAGFNQGLGDLKTTLEQGFADRRASMDEQDEAPRPDHGEQWRPVLEHVAGISAALEAIGRAIDTHQQGDRKTKAKQGAVEAKFDEETIRAMRDLIESMRVLSAGSGAANAAAEASGASAERPARTGDSSAPSRGGRAGEPMEIRVVNKVPATFLYVMKEQFSLMRNWLEPLTRITADQDEQLKAVRVSLETLASRYEDMTRRLERTLHSDDEDDEVNT